MHKGMEILIARMNSHPEEFDITFYRTELNPIRRWDFILKPLMDRCEAIAQGQPSFQLGFLSDDEVGEVFAKLMQVQGDACTQKIMNELLQYEDCQPLARPKRGGVMFGGNRFDDSSQ